MIGTIGKPLDEDLYRRVVEGFDHKLVDSVDGLKDCKVHYFHPNADEKEYNLLLSFSLDIPVVSLGNAWFPTFNPAQYIENGKTGYYSNNVDEVRWAIKRLLEKS
jgi:hypothetical protein